jgi:hypothetical protein
VWCGASPCVRVRVRVRVRVCVCVCVLAAGGLLLPAFPGRTQELSFDCINIIRPFRLF